MQQILSVVVGLSTTEIYCVVVTYVFIGCTIKYLQDLQTEWTERVGYSPRACC